MVDAQKIAAYHKADEALLDQMRQQGDDPNKPRLVDVRFKGPKSKLERVAAGLGTGWQVIQLAEVEGRTWALDIQREQTTGRDAIRGLTNGAIGIEMQYEIEYDGWGCIVQPRA